MQLARLALDAALATPGVVSGSEGPLRSWVTLENGQRLPGVVAAEQADGLVGVTLHLVVEPVPLHPLADGLRSRIEAGAAAGPLAGRLGPVDIAFEDLGQPGAVPGAPPPPAAPPAPAAAGAVRVTAVPTVVSPTPGAPPTTPPAPPVSPAVAPSAVPPAVDVVQPATTPVPPPTPGAS